MPLLRGVLTTAIGCIRHAQWDLQQALGPHKSNRKKSTASRYTQNYLIASPKEKNNTFSFQNLILQILSLAMSIECLALVVSSTKWSMSDLFVHLFIFALSITTDGLEGLVFTLFCGPGVVHQLGSFSLHTGPLVPGGLHPLPLHGDFGNSKQIIDSFHKRHHPLNLKTANRMST